MGHTDPSAGKGMEQQLEAPSVKLTDAKTGASAPMTRKEVVDDKIAFVEQSLAMGTVLAPEIGYEKAAALVKEAYASGRTIREVALFKSGLTEERLTDILDPASQV